MSINILIIEDVDNKIYALGGVIREILNQDIDIFPKKDDTKNFIESFSQKAKESSSKLKDWVKNQLVEYVKNNDIDLIILDFFLYADEEKSVDRIDNSSGYKILEQIRISTILDIPIFANSFKNDSLLKTNDNILSSIYGIIEKKNDKDEYIDYFDRNIFLINRMMVAAKNYKKEKIKSDIVVVCALKIEIMPVIDLLKDKENLKASQGVCDDRSTYCRGHLYYKGDKKLSVVAVTREQMGMAEAATLTTQMIEKFNPKFIVMTGIAAGIDINKQNFLDILMPSEIYNWQSGKFKVIEEKAKKIHVFEQNMSSAKSYIFSEPDLNIKASYLQELSREFLLSENYSGDFTEGSIKDYIKNIRDKDETDRSDFEEEILGLPEGKKNRIKREIESLDETKSGGEIHKLQETIKNLPEERIIIDFILEMKSKTACKIHKEGMVSGSAVVADEELKKEEIERRGIHGIDMEAYGVAYACNKHPSRPEVIILKAICDFADSNKNDIYQSMAAFVSAQAFYKLFTDVIDVEQD